MTQHALPPLPYAYEALEPVIDAATMRVHHDAHHGAYVQKLNAALEGHAELQGLAVEELLARLDEIPEAIRTAVRNNGGGHANHSLFWKLMAPPGAGGGGAPQGELARRIEADLGGLETLQQAFQKAGEGHFGSGWAVLAARPDGSLEITSVHNQDTLIGTGRTALLINDVWEHAYYLKHQNKRAAYLSGWWQVTNWREAEARYGAACEGRAAA